MKCLENYAPTNRIIVIRIQCNSCRYEDCLSLKLGISFISEELILLILSSENAKERFFSIETEVTPEHLVQIANGVLQNALNKLGIIYTDRKQSSQYS